MILHCWICSQGGERLHEATKVATVRTDELRLPLKGSMFGSLMPEREVPPPWSPEQTWDTMTCPKHRRSPPWPVVKDEEANRRFKAQGGPDFILTDQGFFYLAPILAQSSWVDEFPKIQVDKEINPNQVETTETAGGLDMSQGEIIDPGPTLQVPEESKPSAKFSKSKRSTKSAKLKLDILHMRARGITEKEISKELKITVRKVKAIIAEVLEERGAD